MPISRRLAAYTAAFLVLLLLVASLLGSAWRPLDYLVFRVLSIADAPELEDDIRIIDLPHSSSTTRSFDLPDFRARTIDLLQTLSSLSEGYERPRAVILDLYYGSDQRLVPELLAAITALQEKKIRVYGVFDTMDLTGTSFEQRRADHAMAIYERLDGGLLHTRFNQKLGAITYNSHLEIPYAEGGLSATITALPLRVAMDLNQIDEPYPPREYVLPHGSQADVTQKTLHFTHPAGTTSGGSFMQLETPLVTAPDIHDKLLIVASYEGDRVVQGRPGPEHVAWAIDDQRKGNRNARTPMNNPLILIGVVLFAAAWTALIYALLFKYAKSLQTSPRLLALLAFGAGLAALAALSALVLTIGQVLPVGLALFATALAAALAWHFANRFLVTGVAEGSGKYDVFISYSRKDGDWVYNSLYKPLSELRKADGSPLSIFFDRNEISLGEAFTSKYMWAIVDSRHFIPVFSENYYGTRSHGRNEMDLAYKRYVEKSIRILPVAFSDESVPEIYNGLNYLNVTTETAFFSALAAELTAPEQTPEATA